MPFLSVSLVQSLFGQHLNQLHNQPNLVISMQKCVVHCKMPAPASRMNISGYTMSSLNGSYQVTKH